MRFMVLIILCVVLVSCNRRNCDCSPDTQVQLNNDSIIKSYYESPLQLPSRYYFQLDEPNIFMQPKDVIRLELRSIPAGAGEIYRLERVKTNYLLLHKIIRPANVIVEIDTFHISKEKGDEFFAMLESTCYHNLSSDIPEDDEIINGSLHILEINRAKKICGLSQFQFMKRKSPSALQDENEIFLRITSELIILRNYVEFSPIAN